MFLSAPLLAPHGVEEFCVGLGFFQFVQDKFNGSDVVPGEILFSHLECCMSPNGPIRALYLRYQ